MRKLLLASVLACAVATISGCTKSTDSRETKSAGATNNVDELDKMMTNKACQPVDANGETKRKKMGVIPGAILLTSSDSFAANELPADKSKALVFYCANT